MNIKPSIGQLLQHRNNSTENVLIIELTSLVRRLHVLARPQQVPVNKSDDIIGRHVR